jgi:hypothetical protein
VLTVNVRSFDLHCEKRKLVADLLDSHRDLRSLTIVTPKTSFMTVNPEVGVGYTAITAKGLRFGPCFDIDQAS